jgi:hypothetical protein
MSPDLSSSPAEDEAPWTGESAGAGTREWSRSGQAPRVVAPSNRVTIAFPFSQIKMQEPSKELAELASLVHDLVVAMAEWVPEDQLDELQTRAQALRDGLR